MVNFVVSSFIFKDIRKQFRCVEVLQIFKCHLGEELPFNMIFPNLETLILRNNMYRRRAALIIHLSTVKYVEIYFNFEFEEEQIEEFFKLNSQLENAKIFIGANGWLRPRSPDFIPRLKVYCPSLKYQYYMVHTSQFHFGPIHL